LSIANECELLVGHLVDIHAKVYFQMQKKMSI